MGQALIDRLPNDSEQMKYYLQEKLILEVTELIVERMDKMSVTRSQLAQKLERSKGYITQLLDGRANMTLRTLSDIMWALNCNLSVGIEPLGRDSHGVADRLFESQMETELWSVSFPTPINLRCRTVTTKQQDTQRMAG